jgi:hypothetical protein
LRLKHQTSSVHIVDLIKTQRMCLYSAFGKYSDPFDLFHILLRYSLILKYIYFLKSLINLHTIAHNDKQKTFVHFPSGHSTVKAWLVECRRDGCPSRRFPHLHRGTLELCQSDHRVLGDRSTVYVTERFDSLPGKCCRMHTTIDAQPYSTPQVTQYEGNGYWVLGLIQNTGTSWALLYNDCELPFVLRYPPSMWFNLIFTDIKYV